MSSETVGGVAELYLGNILYAIELAAMGLQEQGKPDDAAFYRGIARKLALPKYDSEAPPLPRSLGQALDGMEKSAAVQRWFGPTFLEAYLRHKRSELEHGRGLDAKELCAHYAKVY